MSDLVFSVLIITYNQEKYIGQTLDSIISQQHDYKYEIVVGDDCSKDGTRRIISEYAQKYPQIVKPLFNPQNLGIVKNYFNVVKNCSGKYLMECAGDDFWLPGKVSKQIEYMENNPETGMIYGYAKVWDEDTLKYSDQLFGAKKETPEELFAGNNIPAPTVCLRKEVVDRYIEEINPEERGWLMEDYPMWIYFSLNSKIKFIEDSFAVYREFLNSGCHSVNEEKRMRFVDSYFATKKYLAEKYSYSLDQNAEYLEYAGEYLKFLKLEYKKHYAEKYMHYFSLVYGTGAKYRLKKLIFCNRMFFSIYKKFCL